MRFLRLREPKKKEINEGAEEKKHGDTKDERDTESSDSKNEFDFLDTDSRILSMQTAQQWITFMNEEFEDWRKDKYAKNVPKWRLHYEKTGKLGIKFRGVSKLIVKLNDVQKKNMKFIDKERADPLVLNEDLNNEDFINGYGKRPFVEAKSGEIISDRKIQQRLRLQALKNMVLKNNFNKN